MSGERSEHIAAVPCTRCGHTIRVHVDVVTPRLSVREIAAQVVAMLRESEKHGVNLAAHVVAESRK